MNRICKAKHPPAEVGVDIGEASVLRQGEEDACGTAALPLPAEAAVADAPTHWTMPLLQDTDIRTLFKFNAQHDLIA